MRVQLAIAVGLTGFSIVFTFYLMSKDLLYGIQVLMNQQSPVQSGREWLVDGPHCRIRNTDPFDPSIQEYLVETPPVVCSTRPPLTYISHEDYPTRILSLNRTMTHSYKIKVQDRIECCWSLLTRVSQNITNYNENADKKYKLSPCRKFKQSVRLPKSTEFIYVRCESIPENFTKGSVIYKNMYAMVVEKTPKPRSDYHQKLNVVIIGIDSVSRLSLRRTMPASLNYLLQNNWIEMNGFNKMDDNTFPNLMAILTGRSVPQLHRVCMNERIPIMDNCPTLWKDFHENGYLTSYIEDTPNIGTFNYFKNGFVTPPTDYYLRPFMLAAHDHLPVKHKDNLPVCIGPESAVDVVFQYSRDIVSTCLQKNIPHFGIFWINSLSHNDLNAPGALDHRFLRFLQEIERTGSLNNTLLIALSDHGMRFGKIRFSFHGYFEERLPFLFIHLPKWFLDNSPETKQNLLNNQHRLISPFDLHATLKNFLHGEKSKPPVSCPTCRSIFKPIPLNRTCADAGIDAHWCTCSNFSPVSVKNPLVIQVGNFLHQVVLNRTLQWMKYEKSPPTMCKQRKLAEILRVHQSTPIGQDDVNNSSKLFVIVIVTEPYGLYEATVQAQFSNNQPEFKVLGFISRLDSYFATSKCARSNMLQLYCYCSA